MGAPTVRVPNTFEGVYEEFARHGWGDGLPLIPPTEDLVARMLGEFDPDEVVGVVPGRGEATILNVAVNAVMAGCLPGHLPVVVAAVRAACQDQFNLYGIQVTTNPVVVGGFVNGPVIDALDFNAGQNCLGQGNRSNATVGRALRLVLINVGEGRPGDLDRATHGLPAKYSFFFAENEPENPWEPYHVECGFAPGESTVTVLAPAGMVNMLEPTEDADDMLRVFGTAMRSPVGNDSYFNGEPWLIFSPEHAEVVASAGHTKVTARRELWKHSKLPVRDFSRKTAQYWLTPMWERFLGKLDDETLIPVSETPDRIRIVVAGGPSIHTVHLPSYGDTRSVTVPITDASGQPILYRQHKRL